MKAKVLCTNVSLNRVPVANANEPNVSFAVTLEPVPSEGSALYGANFTNGGGLILHLKPDHGIEAGKVYELSLTASK